MKNLKSIWTTITGSVSSIIPLFFAVCKPGGACAVACASPIASLFGMSSATLTATPIAKSLYPLLLVITAVSFTVSYYKLFVLPKYAASGDCSTDCGCEPSPQSRQYKISLYTFWIGLVASIIFLTYFEYQNYQLNVQKTKLEQSIDDEEPCCATGETCDTTKMLLDGTSQNDEEEKP